jgi:hypothetical protein
MIKKKSELDKSEKLLLLTAIQNGEVDRESLTPDTLYACEYSDYFLSLQVAGSPGNENIIVICLGPARQAREFMLKIGSLELVNGAGEVTETIELSKPNYL